MNADICYIFVWCSNAQHRYFCCFDSHIPVFSAIVLLKQHKHSREIGLYMGSYSILYVRRLSTNHLEMTMLRRKFPTLQNAFLLCRRKYYIILLLLSQPFAHSFTFIHSFILQSSLFHHQHQYH